MTDRHLRVCSDKPILAVFLSHLQAVGKTDDLEDLLGQADFGQWVIKRVQMSFGHLPVDRDLAALVAMFPMSAEVKKRMDPAPCGRLFDILATDGWIEHMEPQEGPEGVAWCAVHDVLADQITLTYCRSIPLTVEGFVTDLLARARGLGCLRQALTALQRLAEEEELGNVPWGAVLSDEMTAAPDAYREVRDLVMATSLLLPCQTVSLLGEHEDVFRGAEGDTDFQNRLGWLCRCAVDGEAETWDETVLRILKSWVGDVVPLQVRSNFVLTWGLRLIPDAVRQHALRWIRENPSVHQTHFLIASWLKTGLDVGEMEQPLLRWAARFPKDFHLSFVVCAWLDAGGDKGVVQDGIRAWLKEHATIPDASYVYKTWLNAGGDKGVVQDGIGAWLKDHATLVEAEFVYKAWLDADGDKGVVQDGIVAWLKEHGTVLKADFVYSAGLEADGDKGVVQDGIAAWLKEHATIPEAHFVYKAWLDADGDKGLVQDAITAWIKEHGTEAGADFVYKAWLDAEGNKGLVQDGIGAWLKEHATIPDANYVYEAWLDAGGDKGLVQDGIAAWIKEHGTEPGADFLYKAWLNKHGDSSLIRESACRWLREHCRSQEAVYLTKFLAKERDIPAQTVRDILTWCQTFPHNEDALWRMSALKHHLQRSEVAEHVCAAAEQIILARRQCREPLTLTANAQMATIICWLCGPRHFRSGPLAARVDRLLLSWLRHPCSYGPYVERFPGSERREYVQRVVNLLTSKQLDPVADRACLKRFFLWVNEWDPARKAALFRTFDGLKHNYPDPRLWETVEFE